MCSPGALLTGPPGVGKSTACRKIAELCAGRGYRVEGFLTEELRERGRGRVGFDIVGLGAASGERVPLARLSEEGGGGGPRVGRYSVSLREFEAMALPILDRLAVAKPASAGGRVVCIVDEIGKMELFSKTFVTKVRDLMRARNVPMLFTVAIGGPGLIQEARNMPGFELFEIDAGNRDDAPARIVERLLAGHSAPLEKAELPATAPKSIPENTPPVARRWKAKASSVTAMPAESAGAKAVSSHSATQVDSPGKAQRVVVWLQNELRLADNLLLQRAVALCEGSASTLLPVVCLDPLVYGPTARTTYGSEKVGSLRSRFLQETLVDLSQELAKRGSRLFVFDSAPEEVLPALAGEGGFVLAARQVCTEEVKAEERAREALRRAGARLELVDGVSTIFGSRDLREAGLGEGVSFPEDFQIFYRAVRGRLPSVCKDGLAEAPTRLPPAPATMSMPAGLREVPSALPEAANAEGAAGPPMLGGESMGWIRMRTWLAAGGVHGYKSTFRRLLGDYSSRLGAHLALGCLSPRRLANEALAAAGGPGASPHIDHFTYELCWRDFFRHAAQRWGAALFQLHGPLGRVPGQAVRPWRRDAGEEARWKEGKTGLPIVDAAMRELRATGYMGNLARQFVASYLLEEVGLDWRVGADWFESCLLDYDVHSNWGQWCRSAGVAPTNEGKRQRVGGYRYFDLALGLPADEVRRYVRAWLPELAQLPDAEVLAPWQAARGIDRASADYPAEPMASLALRQYFEQAAAGGGQVGGGGGRGQKGRGGKGGYRGGKGKGEQRW